MTGIVVYISTFKNEVGYKLRPISQFQEALFDYRYGYSFLFLVTSLLLSELTGTLAIFLYVSQKHFKIMIDTERDQVLEHNIINLLRNQQKIEETNKDNVYPPPILRIISSGDNNNENTITAPSTPQSPTATTRTINQNFLTADFGLLDSAYYQCGRHGTRGRRNSRSNESYLGSPRESTADLKTQKSQNGRIFGKNSFDCGGSGGDPMQELYVEGLVHRFINPKLRNSPLNDDGNRSFFFSSAQHSTDGGDNDDKANKSTFV